MPQQATVRRFPARVLTDPAMTEACASRDFATVFHIAKRAGIYPSRIARQCDLTPSRVGDYMTGRRTIESINVIERIADGLGIPGRMLGLAARPWESHQPTPPATHHEPAYSEIPSTDVDDILSTVDGSTVTPTTLAALRGSIEDYWRRDDEQGGEVLRPAIVGQLRYTLGLLRLSSGATQRNLQLIAAELSRLAGWTYFDAKQYNTARGYFTDALRLAQAAEDHYFVANVMACLSLQATYQDRPADAVALSRAAQDSAQQAGGQARVMSMLATREAFAHARAGDTTQTHAAIDEAQRHFARVSAAEDEPAWVRYFDATKLTVDTGIALCELGDAHAAAPLITQAIEEEDGTNRRGRAFHSIWLARAQIQRHEIDRACDTATTALTIASSVNSRRVTGHIREFRNVLTPFRSSAAARSFNERLRETL